MESENYNKSLGHWGDILALVLYFVLTACIGIWSMCRSEKKSLKGYFLAGRSATWWPIGLSLFASNISSQQLIGQAGAGAASGYAVIPFEWNAIPLILLMTWAFLPLYLACGVYTLPEYLSKRFGHGHKLRMLVSLIFILTTLNCIMPIDLYTGGLFIQQSLGWHIYGGVFLVVGISAVYTILGGLLTVLYTDAIQVVIMILGSLVLTIVGFIRVGGMKAMEEKYMQAIPDSYWLRNDTNNTCGLPRSDALHIFRDPVHSDFPWPGMFIRSLLGSVSYWCAFQTIVQRSLAAKNLIHAKGGALMAAILKISPMYLIVMPGMIARILLPNSVACADEESCMAVCGSKVGCSNTAYPALVMEVLPIGLRGLMLAVLLSAVISSLTSQFNSVATCFTMDLWSRLRPKAKSRELLIVGRLSVLVAIAISVSWVNMLHNAGGGQIYKYFTGMQGYLQSPISVVFLLAAFWPRCNLVGAFSALLGAFIPGTIRFVLDSVYQAPPCGELDTRPFIVKDIHPYYFTTMQLALGLVVGVIVCEITGPSHLKDLPGVTFWSRYKKPKVDNTSDMKIKQLSAQENVLLQSTDEHEKDYYKDGHHDEESAEKSKFKALLIDLCGIAPRSDSLEQEEEDIETRLSRLKEPVSWRLILNSAAVLLLGCLISLYIYYR